MTAVVVVVGVVVVMVANKSNNSLLKCSEGASCNHGSITGPVVEWLVARFAMINIVSFLVIERIVFVLVDVP